jgi:hypothetical protein
MLVYKILVNGRGPYSKYTWSKEWMPDVGTPQHCKTGYYGLRKNEIEEWAEDIMWMGTKLLLSGMQLWVVELGGTIEDFHNKVAGSTARLVRQLGTLDQFRVVSEFKEFLPCKCGEESCDILIATYTKCDHSHFINKRDRIKPCQKLHFEVPDVNV